MIFKYSLKTGKVTKEQISNNDLLKLLYMIKKSDDEIYIQVTGCNIHQTGGNKRFIEMEIFDLRSPIEARLIRMVFVVKWSPVIYLRTTLDTNVTKKMFSILWKHTPSSFLQMLKDVFTEYISISSIRAEGSTDIITLFQNILAEVNQEAPREFINEKLCQNYEFAPKSS